MSAAEHLRLVLYERYRFGLIAGVLCLLGTLLLISALPPLSGTAPENRLSHDSEPAIASGGSGTNGHQEAVQLLDWRLLVGAPPRDSTPNGAGRVQGVAVVMKQITEPDAYNLYRIQDGTALPWLNTGDGVRRPILDPRVLASGDYLLVIQTKGAVDAGSYHAFRIR